MTDATRRVDYGPSEREDVGAGYALLHFDDGTVRFEHECDSTTRGITIVCAPALRLGDGHTITRSADRSTVTPSILCPDCGTHGYVENGAWRAC